MFSELSRQSLFFSPPSGVIWFWLACSSSVYCTLSLYRSGLTVCVPASLPKACKWRLQSLKCFLNQALYYFILLSTLLCSRPAERHSDLGTITVNLLSEESWTLLLPLPCFSCISVYFTKLKPPPPLLFNSGCLRLYTWVTSLSQTVLLSNFGPQEEDSKPSSGVGARNIEHPQIDFLYKKLGSAETLPKFLVFFKNNFNFKSPVPWFGYLWFGSIFGYLWRVKTLVIFGKKTFDQFGYRVKNLVTVF